MKRTPLRRSTKTLKRTPLRRRSKNRIPTLRRKAWDLQSEYIRRIERGVCFTCDVRKDWRETEAGHFIHKDHLDFEEINIHCQCHRCNHYLSGNLGEYALRLVDKYGRERVVSLVARKHDVVPWRVDFLEGIIELNKKRLKDLGGEEGV